MIRTLFSKRSNDAVAGGNETKGNCSKYCISKGKVQKQDKQQERKSVGRDTDRKLSISESKAVLAARKYVELTNKHDGDATKALLDPMCIVYFEEAEILGNALFDEFHNMVLSFPDLHIYYDTVELTASNTAILTNMYSVGTHTGEPYGFGPYPCIQPTGIRVQNDPGIGTITINEETGLITKMRFVAKGEFSGPPGFYKQIGGIIF